MIRLISFLANLLSFGDFDCIVDDGFAYRFDSHDETSLNSLVRDFCSDYSEMHTSIEFIMLKFVVKSMSE